MVLLEQVIGVQLNKFFIVTEPKRSYISTPKSFSGPWPKTVQSTSYPHKLFP